MFYLCPLQLSNSIKKTSLPNEKTTFSFTFFYSSYFLCARFKPITKKGSCKNHEC